MDKFMKKFIENFDDITDYYNYLVELTKSHEYVGIFNEWLIDNYYLLVEHKNSIILEKKINNKKLYKNENVYYLIQDIVNKYNYNLNINTLIKELNKYQKEVKTYLSYSEFDAIPLVLVFVYADKLNKICKVEYKRLQDKKTVEKIIKEKLPKNVDIKITDFLDPNNNINNRTNYIFEINNQLKEFGARSNLVFRELNLMLEEQNISIREILNDEYQRRIESNIVIANIFNNLKDFFENSYEDLLKGANVVEKRLLQDKIYTKMTIETRDLYRKKIIKDAKHKRISEISYVESLFKKSSSDNYHIGTLLFKQHKNTVKVRLYVLCVLVLSIVMTIFLSEFFIDNKILGFIILIIPVSQLIIQIMSHIITTLVSPKPLCKMDYSKGISDDAKTVVVITTLVSDVKKVYDMFAKLETYYLVNKSDNIYFTLLADATSKREKHVAVDDDIKDALIKCSEELNKKYDKELFYFAYRNRFYSKSEECFLGWERKRGALLHFSHLLRGLMSDKDKSKFFYVQNIDKLQDIKYVITLDTDTELVLNTALLLVGAMDHPLNRPILNKDHTKVEYGYGIMQPRVSVDIESTNSSVYAQVFAGIGGFDTYSAIVPNVFQDLFNEGSFIGKGIYNLEVFDEILYNRFPDNLILSHDLLEGNYLRCGYISDVELIDGFPPKFLTDVTRQHRWARGDVQIIEWLKFRVRGYKNKYEKNPISLLGKYKIFDNIARMFLMPALLLVMIGGFFFGKMPSYVYLLFVLFVIALGVLFFLREKLYRKKTNFLTLYYKNIVFGGKALFLRTYITFATIPYYSKLYMDAFCRSIYRMFISHKKLLNWLSMEEAEKNAKTDLASYIMDFGFNWLVGGALVVLGVYFFNVVAIVVGLIFASSPFVLYTVSQNIVEDLTPLDDTANENIKKMAYRTWMFFSDYLRPEYSYLMPDNFQENREEKLDFRTSPTNIGYSLTSVISSYELGFITYKEAMELLDGIIKTLSRLEKWNGHLYNWYDIKTKKAMHPRFVSTIDSGNLVACLIIVKNFIEVKDDIGEYSKLHKKVETLIKNANFKKLYTKKDVFSIGYDAEEGHLSIYNYNKFASESRLTSFVAICKGDVPSKHWLSLDKSLTTYKAQKGLISWSGTSFEYFMPFLFMKNYKNTLLDETYHFAHMCQVDYMESVSRRLPWGISESAYNELDNALNYKYKSFSTPYLKAKEESESRIVISPYSSIMAMELFPKDVYRNLKKFTKLDMYDRYGFYESYDYDNKGVVRAYFAHHQGMCLLSFANYLTEGRLKNYFHRDISIKTFELLLKEKVQVKTNIDMKMARYKKYNYDKEKIENDIRVFPYISEIPEFSVLSNKKYSILINDRGNGFSRYRTLQLNRYRKITEQDYGMYLYIKDLDTDYVWSNTYAPMNIKPDKYEVIFAADKIKYIRKDEDIITKTEIIVTRDHHAEIRKITFKNESDSAKHLELTTYTEPIICENVDDISHKVFNNMFLDCSYNKENNTLTMRRTSRDSNISNYMVQRLIIKDPKSVYTYETSRFNFIGRGHNTENPIALHNELSNKDGSNVEPVMSLRNVIEVLPNSSEEVYLLCGFGRSPLQIEEIVNTYYDKRTINKAFEVSSLSNIIMTKNLNITGDDMRVYNMMLNYLYQTTKYNVNLERRELLKKNALSQSALWKFGISGDRPIILVKISDISDISFVMEILKCFEYYKSNSIFVDIIIVNAENEQYAEIIKKEIDDELYRIYTLNSFYHTPGSVKVISSSDINEEEMILLNMVSRLNFDVYDHKSLKDKVFEIQKHNSISTTVKNLLDENNPVELESRLTCNNSFGGFRSKGSEYVIYDASTPTPWSNVIASKNFGTIVTNNGCGYTYAYNSGEFKITSWSNEMVVNDTSEGIKINGKIFNPTKCIHGFGYSILESSNDEFSKSLTEFVALEDTVKFYVLKIKNNQKKAQEVELEFYINPTFGVLEEKTSRYILTEFMGRDNYLKMRNVYHASFNDVSVFMSSSDKITSVIDNQVIIKSITNKIKLKADEEKTIVFSLGSGRSDKENLELIHKYQNVDTVLKELKKVKDKWKKDLSVVSIKTPDISFNYMMNGWYLYQTISSRILARSGFYQVSGAYGYRDQLQDAMNIATVKPDFTREQILINASHQFMTGDVLHWWHEHNKFGLRSRYKDDYLWLVYATIDYIDVTDDYKILDEKVPYVEALELRPYENEKGVIFNYSEKQETLFEHLLKSLDLACSNMGRHNLPLMGGGDWNDGMNKVGIKGKGESVWLGFFLYDIINRFTKIIEEYKPKFKVKDYLEFNEKLKESLNKNGWDKNYYLRAYFDNGDKLGSSSNDECKIDLISQSFSILSDVIPKEKTEEVLSAIEDNLWDKDLKIVKLLTPPFSKSLNNPGYIKNYPEGIRENGGQYTHAVSWYIMALLKEKEFDKAYNVFQMINPVERTKSKGDVLKYKVEPYVIAADIYSAASFPARGGWTWYTGSAGWFYRIGLREILGFRKQGETFTIKPQVPTSFNKYSLQYTYMDTLYIIDVVIAKKDEVILDKHKVSDGVIHLVNDKKVHKVDVYVKR